MKLTQNISQINVKSYIWHAIFAAIAINFMDFDTVIPAMIIQSGGSAFQVGLLTAILIGGAKISQLIASPFLFYKKKKKPFLILGISIRFIALFAIATSFYYSELFDGSTIILLVFLFISFFSFSEAFASLSYTDIMGKSILQEKRKGFLSLKQVLTSVLIFFSAFAVKQVLKWFEFPDNYSLLFLIASISLFIASFGFWRIKEVPVELESKYQGLPSFLRLLWKELSKNKRLQAYLVIINTLGIGMGMLPFLILYAQNNIGINPGDIGNFVIFKTIGLVLSGLVLLKYAKRIGYKTILYIAITVGALVPIYGIFTGHSIVLFTFVFLLGGIYITFFRIAQTGVLLEISTDTNRVLFAGIAGFGSILVTIFPLMAGLFIEWLGFELFLILISLTLFSSVFFVNKLRCMK
jgi:MFS family permease